MLTWSNWFKESIRLTGELIRAQLAPLLALSLITGVIEIWTEDAMQLAASEKIQRMDLQALMGVTDLVGGFILYLVLFWGIPKVRALKAASFEPQPFASPYLGTLIAENLRMLAQTLLYALLLILPGIYRYCQLAFTPFVAIFSRRYRAGEVDALAFAQNLGRPFLVRIFVLFVVSFALSAALEFLPEMWAPLHVAPARLVFGLLGDVIGVWSFAGVYLLFERAMEMVDDGFDL